MCNFSFSLFPWFLLALISFHLSLFLSLSASRAEGTSEGSGWLSLLEADGRPKARRPRLHEACFEHAKIMSRGMTMDDGCSVQARACLCVSEHFVHRSHSFFPVIFSTLHAGWHSASKIWWLWSPLLLVSPLTPGVFSMKSQIKGWCLGSIRSGQSGGVFKNNVQLCNY